MTEKRVLIDLDREATPDQMMTMQDGIEDSIDHIVFDTLVPDRGYSGLVVSVLNNLVSVGPGRLYSDGKVYAFAGTSTPIDVTGRLPQSTKKQMLIVVSGVEQDTDPEQVNFLDAAASTPAAPVYKPQSVATTHSRLANVQPAYGQEAPNPPTPDYGLALPIAQLLLTPAGVQVQPAGYNLADGKVPVLADVEARVVSLEVFEATVGPEVSTLASGLAALANALNNSASQQVLSRMLVRIADLDAKVGIPSNAADSSSDYLLDGTNSDLTHAYSSCKVAEGARFPNAAAADAVLNLFNPFETAGVVKGGVLFAAYDRYVRRNTGAAIGSVQANAYTYNPVSYTQKTMAQSRVRYGSEFTVCSNSAFWQSGSYDPINGVFTLPNGDTYRAAIDLDSQGQFFASQGNPQVSGTFITQHTFYRLEQFWTDTTTAVYWDAVVQAPQTIGGYHLAETELIGQDQWIDAIGFYLAKLDSQGDVTVLVCEAGDNAAPNPSAVLGMVTVPFSSLKVGENLAVLATPVLLQAGKRVSYVLVTPGAHAVSITDGASFPQGTFFVLAPSGYAQGDLTKHLGLNIYGMKFRQSVATIQLQNLQLPGGIASIDILAGSVVPASTNLTYSVQIAGKLVPLSSVTAGQLTAGGSLQPNLPLFVTLAGTPDMMPALNLAKSNAHVSRPAPDFAHVWPLLPRTPPVPSSQIRAKVRFESFDAAFHTVGCQLLTGAGFLTKTAASSISPITASDGGYEVTYTWNLGAAVNAYKLMPMGHTNSVLNTFHAAWIKDWVL